MPDMPWLVFAMLVAVRNPGFWGYALRAPGAFTASSLEAAAVDGLISLAEAALIALSCWGLGRRLLRAFPSEALAAEPPFSECISFGLGLGTMASSMFALGLAGLLRPYPLMALVSAAVAAAAAESRSLLRGAWKIRFFENEDPLWKRCVHGLLIYVVWHVVIRALAPPTDPDALTYHLALPKLYLKWGEVREVPWMIFAHWPHLMEVLYSLPLALGRDNVAALLHCAACAALIAATYGAGKTQLGETAACWGAVILAAQPAFYRAAGLAHADGSYALFHFLAAACLWGRAGESPRADRAALAGLLSGFASASKLLGIPLSATLALWALARPLAEGRPLAWKSGAAFLAGALAASAPWYLKTWIGAGNPVWPFFSNWLGGRWHAATVAHSFFGSHNLNGGHPWRVFYTDGGPFLAIPFLALCGLRGRAAWPPFLKFLLLPLPVCLILTGASSSFWRYCLPFFPALALAVSWWASRSWSARGLDRAAAFTALAVCVFPILLATQNNELFAVLGARSRTRPQGNSRSLYLERALDTYSIYQKANRLLGPREKVLLWREFNGYYLDVDYQWGSPERQALIPYLELKEPRALARYLARSGITHVLVNRSVDIYQATPEYYSILRLVDACLVRHAHVLISEGPVSLYRIDEPEAPAPNSQTN